MIDEATAPPATRPPVGVDRWRRGWLVLLLVVAVTSFGLLTGRGLEAAGPIDAAQPPPAPSAAAPSAYPSAPLLESTTAPSPSATPSRVTLTAGLLQLPGSVPARGSGTFTYATRRGPVLGAKGTLRRFRVAVERGSGEDAEVFADQVGATLGNPASWIGGGTLRLQLVPGAEPADFTVYLASRDTAGQMCLRGGTDIRVAGRPYTSCRATGKAIINLDRWRLSAKPFLIARVPLVRYRQYVINHEVGHELGHRHQGCPRVGGPAPVMMQQTLTTRGCVPYGWPRRGNRFLVGPAV